MTKTKEHQDSYQLLMVISISFWISKDGVHLWVVKVYVIFLMHVWRWLSSIAVSFNTSLEFLELHNIASQGTSFV